MLEAGSLTSHADFWLMPLGKHGGLRHVEVKPSILRENVLDISQDLSASAHLAFDVPIVKISKRPAPGPAGTLQATQQTIAK